jgi:ABC-type sugar transport system permease subunit
VTPALVIVGLLTVAPLLYGIFLSFTNWSLTTSPSPHLEGVAGYAAVLRDPQFLGNLVRTIAWTVFTVAIEVVVAVPLALLLNLRTPVTGFLTGLMMIPWITPFVVLSYAWLFLYSGAGGPIHTVLEAIGLAGKASPLATGTGALPAIILISGWKGIPFLTVAVLAALKGIPGELYEAGAVDGANRFRAFWNITLPLLRAVIGAMCVVLAVQAFYSFDLVWILTQGGPGYSTTLLGVQLYQSFFTEADPGQAAALGCLMLILALVLVIPIIRGTARRGES